MMFIAHGLKYFLGYLRAPFLVHYYSIYLYVTYAIYYIAIYDTANYADDNSPYSTGNGIHNIVSDLEQASAILSKWFNDNHLKTEILCPDQISCPSQRNIWNSINSQKCSNCQQLLWKIITNQIRPKSFYLNHMLSHFVKSKTQRSGTDGLFFKVQTKKIIIKHLLQSNSPIHQLSG